jgi:hypothetical protein
MTGKTLLIGVVAASVVGGASWVAFGRTAERPVPIAPVATELAPSVGSPSSKAIAYAVEPKSRTSISMPAPKEKIRAITEMAGGVLRVDLANLPETRGEVKIDLTTLSTHTFGNDDDESQTRHARTWLEVGDATSPELREQNRWVVYAIRSIESASATDASKIPPIREGSEDVRTVTLTAKGDLLLHGHKVEGRTAELEARLHYPPMAPSSALPTLIEIASKTPLRVILAEHDVKPRDGFGKLAQGSFKLLGTKVADVAEVSLDLRAVPGPS